MIGLLNTIYFPFNTLKPHFSSQKKPIVGHNMFMDIFYLVRQFFEPLAETLKAFKKQVHKIFPNIFDTKHICNQKFRTDITNSTLKNLFDSVAQAPFRLPTIGEFCIIHLIRIQLISLLIEYWFRASVTRIWIHRRNKRARGWLRFIYDGRMLHWSG